MSLNAVVKAARLCVILFCLELYRDVVSGISVNECAASCADSAGDDVMALLDCTEKCETIDPTANSGPAQPTDVAFGIASEGLGPDGINVTARDALQWLLSPTKSKDFFAEKWQRKHHVIRRQNETYYRHIFSPDDVDEAFEAIPLIPGSFGVHKGSFEPLEYANMIEGYLDGGSIVINGFQSRVWALASLCKQLQGHFYSSSTNLYLSPRNASAFSPHSDAQDIFILQVSGRKTWTLFPAPVEMPYAEQEVGKRVPTTRAKLGRPLEVIELYAGDLLYIPRGVPHEATGPSSSMHLTLTVASAEFSWGQLMESALRNLYLRDAAFREALPLAHFHPSAAPLNPAEKRDIEDQFAMLLKRARESINFKDALKAIKKKVGDARELRDKELKDLQAVKRHTQPLTTQTVVQRREGVQCAVRVPNADSSRIEVKSSERSFNLLPTSQAVVENILAQSGKFKVSDITDPDSFHILFIVKQLLNMGVLVAVN